MRRLSMLSILAPLALVACANDSATTETPVALRKQAASDDPLGALPDDLVIDVTVLPGRGVERESVQEARGKYILFPDGSLHADVGRTIGVLSRPARARTITREEMADLWLLARQSGFGDPASAEFKGNPALLAPAPGEVLTIVSVSAEGQRGAYVRRAKRDAPDAASARLVRACARLAWAADAPPSETSILPLRYDLGPDPYARYRPTEMSPTKDETKSAPASEPSK